MNNPKLQVVAVIPGEKPPSARKDSNPQQTRRQEAQAKYERLWHLDPEQFNPFTSCWGNERIDRTLSLFRKYSGFKDKKCVDLGCGWGAITLKCAEEGGNVDSVDIASQALERVKGKSPGIKTFQDYVPQTLLADSAYDVVIATEIIGELPQQEYRLFFSELARLVKKDGRVLCSTPLDIYSMDAFDRFRSLAETELDIIDGKLSYNYLWIKLGNVLTAPDNFGTAVSDKNFRNKGINERHGLIKAWFKLNSLPVLGHVWKGISWISNPFHRLISRQRWLLRGLESLSKFFWNEQAVSHVIIVARRRPLIQQTDPNKAPPERQQKQRLWE